MLGQMRMPGNPDHIDAPDSLASYRQIQICIEQRLELCVFHMVVIKARLTFNSNWQVIVETNLVLVDAISEQVYQIQCYTYAKSSFVTQDYNILLNDPMSGAHTAAAGREFHCEIHQMEKKRFLTSVRQRGVKIL